MRAAVVDRKILMSIYSGLHPVIQKWVQGHFFRRIHVHYSPYPERLHAHHRRLENAGAETGWRALLLLEHYCTESLGTWTNHFSLSWDIFNWGQCMFHYLTHWKGRGDFLKLQLSQQFPTHPTKIILSKADKLKGWVIFSTEPPRPPHTHLLMGYIPSPSEQPHCIPSSILEKREDELFANNATGWESWPRPSSVTLGGSHTPSTGGGATDTCLQS